MHFGFGLAETAMCDETAQLHALQSGTFHVCYCSEERVNMVSVKL